MTLNAIFNENWYLWLFWSVELIGNDENCIQGHFYFQNGRQQNRQIFNVLWGSTFLWSLVKIGSSVSENLFGQAHSEKKKRNNNNNNNNNKNNNYNNNKKRCKNNKFPNLFENLIRRRNGYFVVVTSCYWNIDIKFCRHDTFLE
jgi:hypothetical protein